MVERFIPLFGGVDGDPYRLVDGGLAYELVQPGRPQRAVVAVDLGFGRVDYASDCRAFLACVVLGRHRARRRKALRLATASGWSD